MPAEGPRLLLVDDDPVTGIVLQRQCARAGYRCRVFQSGPAALEVFATDGADILVTDLRMPHMNGFEFLERVRALDPNVPILVMTGYSSIETAVESMKRGANDFIKKPFDFEELNVMIERTLQARRGPREPGAARDAERGLDRYDMIGRSPAMQRLYHTIEKVAPMGCHVIITGGAGTGKTLVARALHQHGARPHGPFVTVDCAALPESLMERELFGHERGAFPGDQARKPGILEQACGGTLFLDEVASLTEAMKAKLVRVLQEQRITRIGAHVPIDIDVRLITADHRDLADMVAEGDFPGELYDRLNGVTIRVPGLDERREDIPALVQHFVGHYARRYNRTVRGFDASSLERLCAHTWPENVCALRNAVERCVILTEGPELTWPQGERVPQGPASCGQIVFPEDNFPSLDEIERQYIEHVLQRAGGKKTRAARILEINKTTLWRKLRRNQPDT